MWKQTTICRLPIREEQLPLIAQWIIYNWRRTCLILVEIFTSQISIFILKSVKWQANRGSTYKNLPHQLLICSWCRISVIIKNNVGYFHWSNLIFFLCSSKQCYWLDKWYFTIFNNHPIKFFGKLIIMYENNPTIWD